MNAESEALQKAFVAPLKNLTGACGTAGVTKAKRSPKISASQIEP